MTAPREKREPESRPARRVHLTLRVDVEAESDRHPTEWGMGFERQLRADIIENLGPDVLGQAITVEVDLEEAYEVPRGR